jgi:hypothetical protein
MFGKFPVEEIVFEYEATDRNGPLQDFFAQFLGVPPAPHLGVPRQGFFAKLPPLHHRVEETANN